MLQTLGSGCAHQSALKKQRFFSSDRNTENVVPEKHRTTNDSLYNLSSVTFADFEDAEGGLRSGRGVLNYNIIAPCEKRVDVLGERCARPGV